MIQAALFAGAEGEPILLRVGSGYIDDTVAYEMVAHSRALAPAGPGGECIFTLLYLTTLHYDEDVSVWITPIIDDVAQETQRLDLTGVMDSLGERGTHEIGLSEPYMVGGSERLRTAPRGTWFSLRIETKYGDEEAGAAAAAAKVVIESVELEYEIVRESRQAIA